MEEQDFLVKLQTEAKMQANLAQDRLLPTWLEPLSLLMMEKSWLVILVFSLILASATTLVYTLSLGGLG